MTKEIAALPILDSAYSVSPEQAARYQRDGHILLRNVCSHAEIVEYRPVIVNAVDLYTTEQRPLEERDTYGKAFLQITNLWVRDECVRRFVLAKRFARIAAELMGVNGVRLYHDQALFKEGGGGHTPWHQDQHYWPLATDHSITMWMPLTDISSKMGVMGFASGSHRMGYLGDMPISDESEAKWRAFVRDRGFTVVPGVDMAAGDATFHSGWTLHHAPPNETDRTREVMTIIYFADGARVSESDNANRVADLATWFPGLKPGDAAASSINPVVYSEE